MPKKISKYYLYQLAGWGLLLIGLSSLEFFISATVNITKAGITMAAGLFATHLLRAVIVRYGWTGFTLKKVWPRLLCTVFLACALAGLTDELSHTLLTGMEFSFNHVLTVVLGIYLLLIVPWTGIYLLFHHIEKSEREGSRKRQLELRLEVMEKQSETSGTNMDVIMDTLKRIESLIEEDPARSRQEITAFSDLLRKGYMRS